MVVIIFGLPGSGKTYFAGELAARMQAVYISSDQLRKQIIREPEYSPAEKSAVYREMLRRSRAVVLRENADVVVDATFHLAEQRRLFQTELKGDAPVFLIEVQAPEELIRQRLSRPREDSDANFEVYQLLQEQWEPEEEDHLVLESGEDNLEEMLRESMNHLHIVYDEPGRP